jgi:thiol-disulfide isomerase/thioredoxin
MITLNKSTFSQALTGKSLVFFHRLKGCANCDKMLPIVESYNVEGLNVFDVDCDAEKDLVQKYAPKGNWNLPLFVYMENGQVMSTKTGVIDIEDATKTLQNISNFELQQAQIDLELERAKKNKEMFEISTNLNRVNEEIQKRILISQQVQEVSKSKAPVDLSGFPEGQSPEEGECEGCGSSNQ